MPRPLIGVVTQTIGAEPPLKPAQWSMSQRYIEVLSRFGALPVLIPLLVHDPVTLQATFDRLDGLVLAGGADIHPSRYGETPHPALGATDPDRDTVEIQLTQLALAKRRPLLAICRGHQVLNVAQGGSLYQDIDDLVPGALKHDLTAKQGYTDRCYLAHDVTLTPGSQIAQILDKAHATVNSIHHQAIKELGQGLRATGFSADGIIEAIEGPPGQFCLGVQWHPEELIDDQPEMARIFEAFVEAAKG